MRALVELAGRSIGDLALDIPLLRLLVRVYPEIHLEVLVQSTLVSLLEDCAFIRRRHVQNNDSIISTFLGNTESLRTEWDLIVMARLFRFAAMRKMLRATVILTPEDRDEKYKNKGILLHRLSILRKIIPTWDQNVETEIPLLAGRVEHALHVVGAKQGERLLTIAPGSSGDSPVWSQAQVVVVVEAVRDLFDRVLVVGHAGNSRHCLRIATELKVLAVAGSLPMPYACSMLGAARLHLGSDDCLAQIAAMQGTATVRVGGNSDGYRRPWRQHFLAGVPDEIELAKIIARVRTMVED